MRLLSLLFLILPLTRADSDGFTLKLHAPDTLLSEANLYIDDDLKFVMSNSSDTITGLVKSNGSLAIDDPSYLAGIGKNYLSLSGESASFEIASPFSIKDGYLKLYASDFHAVPSGEDGIYVLGSINAAAGRDTVIVVAIQALGDDGVALDDYSPYANMNAPDSAQAASTAITALDTSQTAVSSTSTTASSSSGSSSDNGVAAVLASPLIGLLALFMF